MVGQLRVSDRLDSNVLFATLSRLFLAATLAAMGTLLLVAFWLMARRAAGQLQEPLGVPLLLTVALILAGSVSLARIVWRRHHWAPRRWRSWPALLWCVPSSVTLLLAGSLSMAGTGATGLVLFWSILCAVEIFWWGAAWRGVRIGNHRRVTTAPAEAGAGSVTAREASPGSGVSLGEAPDSSPEEDELLSADVSQQMTRSWAEADDDTVVGFLRARFAPKQRSRSLHVAFCPAMLHQPTVSILQVSGPRARIKAADVRPFGIRFDVRLAVAGEEPGEVLIHFQACCRRPEPVGDGEARTRPV